MLGDDDEPSEILVREDSDETSYATSEEQADAEDPDQDVYENATENVVSNATASAVICRAISSASIGAHITSLSLPSCMLRDEDVVAVFEPSTRTTVPTNVSSRVPVGNSPAASQSSAAALPFLFHLDLSKNLLESFPLYIFGRCHLSTPGHAATPVIRIPSPWTIDVSDNVYMRQLSPLVLETPLLGGLMLKGCDALSPAVVVGALKGLVCGNLSLPVHTDRRAALESMLGVLSIDGTLTCASGLAPQHARKCEEHLQYLRRHLTVSTNGHHAAPHVATMLHAFKFLFGARHVEHPRLLPKYLMQLQSSAHVFLLDLSSTVFALTSTAKPIIARRKDMTPSSMPAEVVDEEANVDVRLALARVSSHQLGSSLDKPLDVPSLLQRRPYSVDKWARLLELLPADDTRCSRLEAAVAFLFLRHEFPSDMSHNTALMIVNDIVEEIALALRPEEEELINVVDGLLGTAQCWEPAAVGLVLEHLRHHGTSHSRLPWLHRRPVSITDLPLPRLLDEVGAYMDRRPAAHVTAEFEGDAERLRERVRETEMIRSAELSRATHASDERQRASKDVEASARVRVGLMQRALQRDSLRSVSQSELSTLAGSTTSPVSLSTRHLSHSEAEAGGVAVVAKSNGRASVTTRHDEVTSEQIPVEASDVTPLHKGFLPVRVMAPAHRRRGSASNVLGAYCINPTGPSAVAQRDDANAAGDCRLQSETLKTPARLRVLTPTLSTSASRVEGCVVVKETSSESSHSIARSSRVHTPSASKRRPSDNSAGAPQSLLDFLRRRGQLRLQTLVGVRTIEHAVNIDATELLDSSFPATASPDKLASHLEYRTLAAAVGVSIEEWDQAYKLLLSSGGRISEKALQDLTKRGSEDSLENEAVFLHQCLGLIHNLLHPARAPPGEVFRVFAALACVTCVSAGISVRDLAEAPEQLCTLVHRTLAGRGTSREDAEAVMDSYLLTHLHGSFFGGGHTEDASEVPLIISQIGKCDDSEVDPYHRDPQTHADRSSPVAQRPASQASVRVADEQRLVRRMQSVGLGPRFHQAAVNTPTSPLAGQPPAAANLHPFQVEAQEFMRRARLRRDAMTAAAHGQRDTELERRVKRSCSASLQPLRRQKAVPQGRSPTDWVISDEQFIPSVVRSHLAESRRRLTKK